MGEHERIRKSIDDDLSGNGCCFVPANMLNVNSLNVYLHSFNADSLKYVQADAFRHNKCGFSSTQESLTKNIKPQGEAKNA
jgi:hypothetical protein